MRDFELVANYAKWQFYESKCFSLAALNLLTFLVLPFISSTRGSSVSASDGMKPPCFWINRFRILWYSAATSWPNTTGSRPVSSGGETRSSMTGRSTTFEAKVFPGGPSGVYRGTLSSWPWWLESEKAERSSWIVPAAAGLECVARLEAEALRELLKRETPVVSDCTGGAL